MSQSEETDEPSTGVDRSVPPAELDEPLPHFAVVITGDGFAAIDGEPVEAVEGEPVDATILDTLHRNARERNTPVTAAISDPSAGYVAYVEVTPDGSSRLLDQPGEQPPEQVEQAVPAGPAVAIEADDDLDVDHHEHDEDPDDDFDRDDGPNALPLSPGATPAPAFAGPAPQTVHKNESRRQSDDEYKGPGLLNRPLVVGPVALAVAALVIVPLVIMGSSDGKKKQDTRSSSATGSIPHKKPRPTASVSPFMLPLSPSTSPSPKPKAKAKAKPKHKPGTKTGEVIVTITARPPQATATVTAKPRQETAVTAVNRLAKNDPGGRHICYRAYVSGRGWQKPVCDGTIAGTTGQNRAIKALNIAVRGVGGSAASAFVHKAKSTDGKGYWNAPWAPVSEGKNLYIGSSKAGAPNMSGFAIDIGSGKVCQLARVHNAQWGSLGCADPRPNFIFGGTVRNDTYLEAVRLSV